MFYIDDFLYDVFVWAAAWVGFFSMVTYVIVVIYQQILMQLPQNLKKKYNAEWALVTGASSGIGKAIAIKLAKQDINVVLVALDDPVLAKTYEELQKQYSKVTFRKVGVNLGLTGGAYMDDIIAATKDIDVNIVFNNAGFILPGLIADTDISKIITNYECNATAAVYIAHHFARKIMETKKKGLITFTSSAAGYIPGPTSTMYSSTKAFLTNFGMTLAGELSVVGIDVVVMHPSPVASRFYEGTASVLSSLKAVQGIAVGPEVIADQFFAAAGRLVVWDQGLMCAGFRIAVKVVDLAFLGELINRFACLNGDFQNLAKKSDLRKKNA